MALVKTHYPSINSLFDDFFNTELVDWKRQNYSSSDTTLSKANIKEDDNSFAMEMAAPDIKKADFNIPLDNNVLTISSKQKKKKKRIKTPIPEGNLLTKPSSVLLPYQSRLMEKRYRRPNTMQPLLLLSLRSKKPSLKPLKPLVFHEFFNRN